MTHINEAREAAAELQAAGDPALGDVADAALADPVVGRHLALGAVLPDLREATPAIAFSTHDRGFALHLLGVAADPARSLADRALALGCAAHVASDVAAQLFAVPHFVSGGRVGAADVLVGVSDDRPDGENELLVELILDVYFGDVQLLLDMYDWFQPQPPAPERADAALGFWLAEAVAYFGAETVGDPAVVSAAIQAELARFAETLTPGRRDQLVSGLELLRDENLGDVVLVAGGLGLLTGLAPEETPVELDRQELARLQEAGPFFGDRAHFDGYPQWLHRLGPTILVDTAHGRPWLENWRTWQAEPMAAATITSLAGAVGDGFAARADLGVSAVAWEDPATGAPIAMIDAAAPPARVRLVVDIFPLAEVGAPLRLSVRKAIPGGTYFAGAVLASVDVPTAWSPLSWEGAPPRRVSVEVELAGDALVGAAGLHAELAGDGITFTSAWEPFAALAAAGWPMDRPVYTSQFGTYGRWPGSLPVAGLVPDTTPPSAPELVLAPTVVTPDAPELTITLLPGAGDPQTGVCSYRVRAGRAAGGAELLAETIIDAAGPAQAATLAWPAPAAELEAGGELLVTALAVNCAGLAGPEAGAGPVTLDPGGCGCRVAGRRGRGAAPAALVLALALSAAARGSRKRRRRPPPG